MEMISVNGVAINTYEVGPKGAPTVIFSNSLGTDLRKWLPFIPFIPNQFRAIFYDKRGHGLSEISPNPFSINELTDDLIQIAEAKNVKSFCIVGVSIGGQIGLNAAAKYPEKIGALVFSNTAPKIRDNQFWDNRMNAIQENGLSYVADGALSNWFSKDYRTHNSLQLQCWKAMFNRTTLKGYLSCCEVLKKTNLVSQAKNLSQETLVIGGTEDGSTPPEMVKEGFKYFQNARLEIMNGPGHIPHIEKPKEYSQLIFSFIESTNWFKNL